MPAQMTSRMKSEVASHLLANLGWEIEEPEGLVVC